MNLYLLQQKSNLKEIFILTQNQQTKNKLEWFLLQILIFQANYMDPQVRILLEVAYEAIIDAGECYFLNYVTTSFISSLCIINYSFRS